MNKILLCGDSFGTPREGDPSRFVSLEQTWPYIVKDKLAGYEVFIDFKVYRKLIDIGHVIEKYPDIDTVVIQAGIVDIFPRPLPEKYSVSRSFASKLLRRVIRFNKSFWIKYIYSKPYVDSQIVFNFLVKLSEKYPDRQFYLINVCPISKSQELNNPNANRAISEYNFSLNEIINGIPNFKILELAQEMQRVGNEKFIYEWDSHFNAEGNRLLAKLLLQVFQPKYHW